MQNGVRTAVLRIRITLMRIRIVLFHFDADVDPEPAFDSDADPDPTFKFDADHSLFSRFGPSNAPKWLFHFDADPDLAFPFDADPDPAPAFQFDVDLDPDPASQNDSNPCGFGSITLPDRTRILLDPDGQQWLTVRSRCKYSSIRTFKHAFLLVCILHLYTNKFR